MNCELRLDPAVLSDYWLGALEASEEDSVEEHLFACEQCAARMGEIIALAEGVRRVAQEGSLMMVVSDAFLERAKENGARVREYALPAGGSVQCTVTAEDDLLIGRLEADLHSAAKRIDLSLCDPSGAEQFRLSDIPFAPDTGGVVWQQSIRFAKAAPTSTMVARLLAVDEKGAESVVGEYTFNHTRTLPGPGAW
jgi:hypothetical protein